jgi:uncharacterized damage-inducible protein DinB
MNYQELNVLTQQIINGVNQINSDSTPEQISKKLKTIASLCNHQAKKIDLYVDEMKRED